VPKADLKAEEMIARAPRPLVVLQPDRADARRALLRSGLANLRPEPSPK
jgi:hypothetical protein